MRLKNSIWSVSFKNPNVLAKRSHLWHVNLTLDTKASNVPTSTTVMNTPIVHTPSVHLTVTLTPESRECRESRNRPSRVLPETSGPMHSGEGRAALVEQQRWEWSNRFHQVVNYLLDRWIVRDLTPFLKIVFWMTFVVGRVKETSQSAHAVSSAGTETLSPLQAALTYCSSIRCLPTWSTVSTRVSKTCTEERTLPEGILYHRSKATRPKQKIYKKDHKDRTTVTCPEV